MPTLRYPDFTVPKLSCLALLFSTAGAFASPEWEGGLTLVHQATDDSRAASETTASADLMATWSRPRGSWFLYVEGSTEVRSRGVSAFYPTANADAGSVLAQDGDSRIQVSELNYTFRLGPDRSLALGLVDPSAWLDRGRIANDENQHFINGSFVNNATIQFPDYAPGAIFRWLGAGSRPELTFLLTGSEGIADLPDRSYQNLLDVTSDERGAFLGVGASWLRENWSWRVGAWGRTDNSGDPVVTGGTDSNFGAYAVLGWRRAGHAINARIGAANPDVAIVRNFVALAYEFDTGLGLFGAGVARAGITEEFGSAGRDYGVDVEAFWRIPVLSGGGHVTPSLQYIRNPGLDASGEQGRRSALIFGLRLHWGF